MSRFDELLAEALREEIFRSERQRAAELARNILQALAEPESEEAQRNFPDGPPRVPDSVREQVLAEVERRKPRIP